MEISSQRIETFDRIAESFSWALSHSRVSVESLGEFATLLYLIKHDQLRKFSDAFKSVTAQREIKQKLRTILWIKYGLKDQEVFDKAYSYIEMYY